MSETSSTAHPGWYPDPQTGQQRWWDGQQWGRFAPPAAPVVVQPATNGLAVASFVLGIVAVLTGWIIFLIAIPVMVIGAVLGFVGLGRSYQVGSGRALSIWGIVLNVAPFVVFGVIFLTGIVSRAVS